MVITKEEVTKIIESYTSGLSSRQVGKIYTRSPSGIRLILKRNNIQLRTRSKANLINEDVRRGKEHFNWNGGRSFHKGQVYINLNHKRIKESHYNWCIANSMLQIPKGMIIHHIDGNSKNNNAKNLVLLNQSIHVNLHSKIEDEKFRRYFEMRQKNINRGDYDRNL